jgi:hypothetical protein
MTRVIALKIETTDGRTFEVAADRRTYKLTLTEAITGRIKSISPTHTGGDIIFRAPAGCEVRNEFNESLLDLGFKIGEYGLTIYLENYSITWEGPLMHFEDKERNVKFVAWTAAEMPRN